MFYSSHFRKLFLIRFAAYFSILTGILIILLILEPVVTEEGKYRLDRVLGRQYTLPRIITSTSLGTGNSSQVATRSATQPTPAPSGQPADTDNRQGFGSLPAGGNSNIITPVDTDFGIVVEKINANAKIVADVDPSNETEYSRALGIGVAHAKGTSYPGEKGNIYLFSHSVDAPWNIVRYNAIFYLLGKLEAGDRIILFYQGRRYDYLVFDKKVVEAGETRYLTEQYGESVLTLQTCDPPGTLVNRLIVRAKLAGN